MASTDEISLVSVVW